MSSEQCSEGSAAVDSVRDGLIFYSKEAVDAEEFARWERGEQADPRQVFFHLGLRDPRARKIAAQETCRRRGEQIQLSSATLSEESSRVAGEASGAEIVPEPAQVDSAAAERSDDQSTHQEYNSEVSDDNGGSSQESTPNILAAGSDVESCAPSIPQSPDTRSAAESSSARDSLESRESSSVAFDSTLEEVPTALLAKDYSDALRRELERESTVSSGVQITVARRAQPRGVQIAFAKPRQLSNFSVLDAKPGQRRTWRRKNVIESQI